jgi:multidrug efflux system membrane fusion protein
MDSDSPTGDGTPADKTKTRRWRWAMLIVLGILIVAGIVYQSVTFLTQPVQTRRGRFGDAGGAQSVAVATIGRGDIRIVMNALGSVTPLTTVTVNTQISGLLMRVGFQEGQLVHKGQFLAQIDPRPYQIALEQDQAQLARDDATLKQAEMDLARYKTLADQTSIARQTYEDQAWVVKQDQGTVDYDKAQIKAQRLNLVYCHIVAPADGRVGLRLIDPGNYVQAATTSGIVVLTLLNPISVVFNVPEDSIPKILARVHAGAKLPLKAFDRANVTQLAVGEVASIDNEVDTTTGTVRLRANFDNAADTLFPSQFVNVVMLLDTQKDVVTVPIGAVQRGAPGTYVYVVADDNTVSVRTITVGAQDAGYYAVESGLKVGERVVTQGADRLREGAHVNIPPPPNAAGEPGNPAGGPEQGRHRHGGPGRGPGRGPGQGEGPYAAPGESDADAAARRERWRQRRQQQDQQTPPGQPLGAPPPVTPPPSGKPPPAPQPGP